MPRKCKFLHFLHSLCQNSITYADFQTQLFKEQDVGHVSKYILHIDYGLIFLICEQARCFSSELLKAANSLYFSR